MSMQQREIATAKLKGPRIPVAQKAVNQHGAAYRQSLAKARRQQEIAEAESLGVQIIHKLNVSRLWQEWEDDIIRRITNDKEKLAQALPHRSDHAIRHRRLDLGVNKKKSRAWTTSEERVIRDNYLKVSTAVELAALLPGRHKNTIYKFMRKLGLSTPPPAHDSGSSVVDAIKDRCRILGYKMKDLDRIAGTGRYFQDSGWRGKSRAALISGALTKAINALGGELRVDWPD